MQFLNPEIAALTKRKKTQSLIKPEISCGIFQDVEKLVATRPNQNKGE
jgi:hypothetical protein